MYLFIRLPSISFLLFKFYILSDFPFFFLANYWFTVIALHMTKTELHPKLYYLYVADTIKDTSVCVCVQKIMQKGLMCHRKHIESFLSGFK